MVFRHVGKQYLKSELVRGMRVLVGIGFAAEGDEESYTATPLTIQITRPIHQTSVSLYQPQNQSDLYEFGERLIYLLTASILQPVPSHNYQPGSKATDTARPPAPVLDPSSISSPLIIQGLNTGRPFWVRSCRTSIPT